MLRRLILVTTAAALALLATAGPASAHVELKSSDPAKGTSLSAAPTSVTLTFSAGVTANPESIKVTAPDGGTWAVSEVTASGSTVTASVTASGPAGVHVLAYRVTSDDGHIVTGTIRFTLTPAAVAKPTTTAAPTTTTVGAPISAAAQAENTVNTEDDGGLPSWFWVLFSAALVWGALWLFRRKPDKE